MSNTAPRAEEVTLADMQWCQLRELEAKLERDRPNMSRLKYDVSKRKLAKARRLLEQAHG